MATQATRTTMATQATRAIIATGAVFSSFLLNLHPVQAHGGLHQPLPPAPPFVDPLASGSVFYGNPLSLGNGMVRTYVKTDGQGDPSEIGYIFDKVALTGLPELPVFPTASLRLFPPLPANAPATAFKHVELIYWSHGHDPALSNIADLMHPHIDFTYFFITNEQRDLICPHPDLNNPVSPFVCTGEELAKVLEPPPPGAIPTDFIQVPPFVTFYGLQRAGTAYFDPSETLDPFTQTVFYGFNEGKLSYIDVPMGAGFIEEFGEQPNGGSFTRPIKQPAGGIYPEAGFYPTNYTLTYNPNSEQYTMSLGGLRYRSTSVPESSSALSLLAFGALGVVTKLKIGQKKPKLADEVNAFGSVSNSNSESTSL